MHLNFQSSASVCPYQTLYFAHFVISHFFQLSINSVRNFRFQRAKSPLTKGSFDIIIRGTVMLQCGDPAASFNETSCSN